MRESGSCETERDIWNRKYGAEGVTLGIEPSRYLVECLPEVCATTEGRRALDVACGEGRNSLYLAARGFETVGVDVSDVALDIAARRANDAGLGIDFRHVDLREETVEGPYDLALMFNFLLRPLLPTLAEQLAPGGYLIIESMMQEYDEFGAPRHRAEFIVEQGELASLVSATGFAVLRQTDDPARAKSRVFARKGSLPKRRARHG